MYTAGIHISDARFVESIAASSIFVYTVAFIRKQRNAFNSAAKEGGKPKPRPITLLAKLVLPVPGLAILLPLLTYIISVPLNGGEQPAFIRRWALPDFGLRLETIQALRVAGCLSLIGIWKFFTYSMDLLGQSFHGIGVRERPKLVSTGPYGVVRHPGYAVALFQCLVLGLISWNYIPIYAFCASGLSLIVKIPIEEEIIESDTDIGTAYAEYKKKVRYRLVPGVW